MGERQIKDFVRNFCIFLAEHFKEIADLLHNNRVGIFFLCFLIFVPRGRSVIVLNFNAVKLAKLGEIRKHIAVYFVRLSILIVADCVLYKKIIELFSAPNIVTTVRCNKFAVLKSELNIADIQLIKNTVENFRFTLGNRQQCLTFLRRRF